MYGETEARNKALRKFKDGKLKVGQGDLLPVSYTNLKELNNWPIFFKFAIHNLS